MNRLSALLVLGLALMLVTCEERYVYVPATSSGAVVGGKPAADVGVPPEAPRGDVRVVTFGVSDIVPEGASDESDVRALHLRVIVANNSEQPWTLDTREQRVALADRGESRAAYASADAGGGPPLITVPPGKKRVVDLFFPLPSEMQKASELPAFDAIWTVHTDARVVTERTPFERLHAAPRGGYAYEEEVWGAPYWYDPYYPRSAWVGVALPPIYVQRPVIAHRPVLHPPPARRVR
jgi:hypothetical protein